MRKLIVALSLALNLTAFADYPHSVPAGNCVGANCCPQELHCGYYEGCGITSDWSYRGVPGQGFNNIQIFTFQFAFVRDGQYLQCNYSYQNSGNALSLSLTNARAFYINNIVGQWIYGFIKKDAQCINSDAGQCGVNNG